MSKQRKILSYPFFQLAIFAFIYISITIIPLLLNPAKSLGNGIENGNETPGGDTPKSTEGDNTSILDAFVQFILDLKLNEWIFIIASLTFLLTILDFTIGKEKIRNSIHNVFWKIIAPLKLRKFKSALKQKYQLIDLRFKIKSQLSMSKIFIPLKAKDMLKNSAKQEEELSINDLIKNYRKIVITGSPGSGKSLLCKNILYKYSVNNLESIEATSIPIYIKLHKHKGNFIITDQIKLFISKIIKNDSEVENLLDKGRFIIMFDGFDEVLNSEKNDMVVTIKSFIDKYPKCQYVITCRNAVYKEEFDNICSGRFDLMPLKDFQIRSYLEVFNENEHIKSKALSKSLREKPPLFNLAKNPLMLALISFLAIDEGETLPHSRGKFYEKAIGLLLKKHSIGNKTIYDVEKKALQILEAVAWYRHTSSFNGSLSGKEITRAEIEEIIKEELQFNAEEVDLFYNEIILKSGLLPLIDKGNEIHEFIHLSLQEYLVARKCKSDYTIIINKLKEGKRHWLEVSKLWCSISNTKVADFLMELNTIDSILAIECLAETQNDIDFKIEKNLIAPHLDDIKNNNINDLRISNALGNIITTKSQDRKKGFYVFDFLVAELESTNEVQKIDFISKTLATSSILDSAKILVASYEKHEKIFEALTSMGELVVPFLVEIAYNNNIKALHCLKNIKTEDSIKALEQFIWLADDSELSIHAAWMLSNLMQEERTISFLNKIPIHQNKKSKNAKNWIWKPFDSSENSPVFFIANRISYLISESFTKTSQIHEDKIAQELAIPITIELKTRKEELENINGLLIDEKIRKDFESLYKTTTPPSKEMWLSITSAKGEDAYYSFYNSVEYIGLLITFWPFIVLLIWFISNQTILGLVPQLIFVLSVAAFLILYGLKINLKLLPFKKTKFVDFGIYNAFIELPIYSIVMFFLIFISNSRHAFAISQLKMIGINFFFLIIICFVTLSVVYEKKSKNPLMHLLNSLKAS